MTTYPVAEDALTARLTATDADALDHAACAFTAAADEVDAHLARRRAIRAACFVGWTGRAAEAAATAFDDADRVVRTLPGALRGIGDALAQHAGITRDAQDEVRRASLDTYRVPSAQQGVDLAAVIQRATAGFHRSELATRATLWDIGSRAPGGIPVPSAPHDVVLPQRYPWQLPVVPEQWTWRDPERAPRAGESTEPLGTRWDDAHPVVGLDEDLLPVPAYAAALPYPVEGPGEGGPGAGPLLRYLLALAARSARSGSAAGRLLPRTEEELERIVTSSYGWRPAHIDDKVRQLYGVRPGEPLDPWMKPEFLRLIVRSGARNAHVFHYEVKGQPTYMVLTKDSQTGKFFAHQYYADGARKGEFVNAFVPTPAQLTWMFNAESVTP